MLMFAVNTSKFGTISVHVSPGPTSSGSREDGRLGTMGALQGLSETREPSHGLWSPRRDTSPRPAIVPEAASPESRCWQGQARLPLSPQGEKPSLPPPASSTRGCTTPISASVFTGLLPACHLIISLHVLSRSEFPHFLRAGHWIRAHPKGDILT